MWGGSLLQGGDLDPSTMEKVKRKPGNLRTVLASNFVEDSFRRGNDNGKNERQRKTRRFDRIPYILRKWERLCRPIGLKNEKRMRTISRRLI